MLAASDLPALEAKYLLPGLQQVWARSGLIIERGQGALLWDHRGRAFIDLWGGGGVCSVGHAHPRFVEAVAHELSAVIVGSFTSEARATYVQRLASVAPSSLDRVQLFSSGAEAVEAALRLARTHTGRHHFLGFSGAFHGKTMGALSLAGTELRNAYGPPAPGFHIAPYGSAEDVAAARRIIESECPGELAAIIVEPIQGTAGNVIPANEFLPALRKLADEVGSLLIFDEIITGFGRTGELFATHGTPATPDVMIVGKGMGNGVPISGLVVNDALSEARPFVGPSGSSSSYGGNPLSARAALVTLDILLDEGLPERANRIGRWMLHALRHRLAANPLVKTVRGRGLLIGIDLVRPDDTEDALPAEDCLRLFDLTLRRGLIVPAYSASVRINPPLCIDHALAEQSVDALVGALEMLASDFKDPASANKRNRLNRAPAGPR